MNKRVWFIVTLAAVLVLVLGSLLAGCNTPREQAPETQNGQKKDPGQKPDPGKKTDDGQKPDPGQEPVKTPGDYFPLKQGSTWKYRGEGNEYASFTTKVLYTKGNRAQTSTDNGGTVGATVFEVTDKAVTKVFFQGEAYDNKNYLEAQPNQQLVVLKAPLQVGNRWAYPDGIKEIVDLNAAVDTPAGRFEQCIKVKLTGRDSIIYEYYKEGVGMVLQEFISGDARITSTLEKYTVGKPAAQGQK